MYLNKKKVKSLRIQTDGMETSVGRLVTAIKTLNDTPDGAYVCMDEKPFDEVQAIVSVLRDMQSTINYMRSVALTEIFVKDPPELTNTEAWPGSENTDKVNEAKDLNELVEEAKDISVA